MTNDDLDHLLESHDDIVPSSGFTDAVMAAVRDEAWRTPPLRFPWMRAAVGALVAALVVALAVATGLVKSAAVGATGPVLFETGEILNAIADAASRLRLGWMTLALLLTLASVVLSSHLTSRIEEHD